MFDMVRPLVPVNGPPVYPPVDYRSSYEKPLPVSVCPMRISVCSITRQEHNGQPVLVYIQFIVYRIGFLEQTGCGHIVCDMVSIHELGLISFKVEYFVVPATWLQHSSGIVQTEQLFCILYVFWKATRENLLHCEQ